MEINLNTKIIDVVNTRITSLHLKDSIDKANILFDQTNKNILPVIVGGDFKGVLFKQNFNAIEKANKFMIKLGEKFIDISPMKVEDFYKKDVKVLSIQSEIIDALEFFVEYRQYYIPIIDEKKFVGLVTPFDVFKYLIELNLYQD